MRNTGPSEKNSTHFQNGPQYSQNNTCKLGRLGRSLLEKMRFLKPFVTHKRPIKTLAIATLINDDRSYKTRARCHTKHFKCLQKEKIFGCIASLGM